MLKKYTLRTDRENFHNITSQVIETVRTSGVRDGLCLVYSPHTTAGITINENADPDVVTDMLFGLSQAFPDRPQFRHAEGNSAAHLKASCVGSSVTVPIADGRPLLGTWQGIYFCEFDGPRNRTFFVQIN
ncbi:MAG: secondary thiamine-phosphate synthase enzyme YjbQ [Coriobacteriales bacterium]|jgi:secondary thiamine-phosphate synthase enzyme|nr:secondary thiamine-phosphate synthase enzyme YjbQ [Coriobacteriales bacterium]